MGTFQKIKEIKELTNNSKDKDRAGLEYNITTIETISKELEVLLNAFGRTEKSTKSNEEIKEITNQIRLSLVGKYKEEEEGCKKYYKSSLLIRDAGEADKFLKWEQAYCKLHLAQLGKTTNPKESEKIELSNRIEKLNNKIENPYEAFFNDRKEVNADLQGQVLNTTPTRQPEQQPIKLAVEKTEVALQTREADLQVREAAQEKDQLTNTKTELQDKETEIENLTTKLEDQEALKKELEEARKKIEILEKNQTEHNEALISLLTNKNFTSEIEKAKKSMNPEIAYQGIGIHTKDEIITKNDTRIITMLIDKDFDPNNKRFKVNEGGNGKDIEIIGKYITSFQAENGTWINLTDPKLYNQTLTEKDLEKEIANAFHRAGDVKFRIWDQESEIEVTCKNQQEKSYYIKGEVGDEESFQNIASLNIESLKKAKGNIEKATQTPSPITKPTATSQVNHSGTSLDLQ